MELVSCVICLLWSTLIHRNILSITKLATPLGTSPFCWGVLGAFYLELLFVSLSFYVSSILIVGA